MAIPAFRDDGWLPEGHHTATWEEIEDAFGGSPGSRRRDLLERLIIWREELRARSVTGILLLDGSFVSAKPVPGDVDALFVIDEKAETTLRNDSDSMELISHSAIKQRSIGDVFCFTETGVRNFPAMCRLDGFDIDKRTKRPKGLIEARI